MNAYVLYQNNNRAGNVFSSHPKTTLINNYSPEDLNNIKLMLTGCGCQYSLLPKSIKENKFVFVIIEKNNLINNNQYNEIAEIHIDKFSFNGLHNIKIIISNNNDNFSLNNNISDVAIWLSLYSFIYFIL